MSDIDEGGFAGREAVEAKLSEAGADQIRRYSMNEAPEAAPETGTPAETVSADQAPEQDQFTSAESDIPADSGIEEVAETPEPEMGQDPAVTAFLAKYGGDVDKALAGAAHLQRKSGQQSNELGDLRRMVDELSQLRELQQADLQQRQQNQPLDQGTIDWFDQEAYNNPFGAAEYARQQNNNVLFQRALGVMKETNPGDYAVYVNNLNNERLRAEMEQKLQAASQVPADANMHMALQNIRAENPHFVNYDDAIGDTLEKYPYMQKAINDAYASGDRQQLEGALKTLYGLTIGDTLSQLTLTGDTPENTTASSQVAEPTTSESHEPAPEPSPLEQWRDEFRQTAERERKGIWVAD